MNPVVSYLMESGLLLTLVFLVYVLWYKNQGNIISRRWFILVGMVSSIVFPLMHIQLESAASDFSAFTFSGITSSIPPSSTTSPDTIQLGKFMFIGYGLGVCVSLVLWGISFFRIGQVIRRGQVRYYEGYRIVVCNTIDTPFSFFDSIIIPQQLLDHKTDLHQILQHEHAHVRAFHSADRLLISFIQIFFWFHPAVYWLEKEIIRLHEYQADEYAASHSDREAYCALLAKTALRQSGIEAGSHFDASMTMSRIRMLRSCHPVVSRWRTFKMLAFFAICFLFFAVDPLQSSDEKIFSTVDTMPEYVGGHQALIEQVRETMQYPEDARRSKTEGTVFVRFIVEKDGTVSQIELARGFHEDCNEEAMRVVRTLKAWKPGKHQGRPVRVALVLPLKFKLT